MPKHKIKVRQEIINIKTLQMDISSPGENFLILSYNSETDHELSACGWQYIGHAKDVNNNEVHVFIKVDI